MTDIRHRSWCCCEPQGVCSNTAGIASLRDCWCWWSLTADRSCGAAMRGPSCIGVRMHGVPQCTVASVNVYD